MAKKLSTVNQSSDQDVVVQIGITLTKFEAASMEMGELAMLVRSVRDLANATRDRATRAEYRNAELERKVEALIANGKALQSELDKAKKALLKTESQPEPALTK